MAIMRNPIVIALVGIAVAVCGCKFAFTLGALWLSNDEAFDLDLEQVAWMDDGWVYAIERRYDDNSPLVRFTRDSEPEPVQFTPPGCPTVNIEAIARATTNTLVVAAGCYARMGLFLYTFNPSNHEIHEFGTLEYPLPGPDDITFTPDLRLGYIDGGICHSVAKVEDGVPVRYAEPVVIDGLEYPLDADFFAGGGTGNACRTLAQVPVLSGPDVYFAATAGVDDRYALWTAPALIVRMPTPQGTPAVVADGFTKVRDLTVSPDRRLLVVAAARDGVESSWVVDLWTGGIEKLDVPWTGSASISPSGAEIVIATADGDAIFRSLPS